MTTAPPERRRYSILRQASAVVELELERILLNADGAMNYINTAPREYETAFKYKVATDLNWAMSMVYPKSEIKGRFVVAKHEEDEEEDAFIFLKPHDDQI